MKNIERKIQKTFLESEISKEHIEYSIPFRNIIIMILISAFIIFNLPMFKDFVFNHPSFQLPVVLISSASFLILFIFSPVYILILLSESKVIRKKNQLSCLEFLKKRDKYTNKFKKSFGSVNNILNIYGKLKNSNIETSDENINNFYNNLNSDESKILEEIHKKYNEALFIEINKLNGKENKETIKEIQRIIEKGKK